MITNIWLKSQPNKKISYPDCYPSLNVGPWNGTVLGVFIKEPKGENQGSYSIEIIARIEFRP